MNLSFDENDEMIKIRSTKQEVCICILLDKCVGNSITFYFSIFETVEYWLAVSTTILEYSNWKHNNV